MVYKPSPKKGGLLLGVAYLAHSQWHQLLSPGKGSLQGAVVADHLNVEGLGQDTATEAHLGGSKPVNLIGRKTGKM
jgi:hypothetical protein